MTPSLRSWTHGGLAGAAVSLALFSAACSSPPGRAAGGRPEHRKPPAPMAGHETFFGGQILAEINVGTDGMPRVSGGEHPGGNSARAEGRERHGDGRRQMGIGGGGYGGDSGMPPGGERDGPRGGMGAPRLGMGGGQPVMIRLRFTNQGNEPVTLVIDDFSSPLGNFAVRPESLRLEPGQPLEPEAMGSRSAGAFAEIDATLVLRLGDKSEKQTLHLRPVQPPAHPENGSDGKPQALNPPRS